MHELRVNRCHHPVTVLGHGTRAGIWVQGCSIGCTGCVARDTWSSQDGAMTRVDALVAWLAALPAPLDGLTVSGGEPFEQPEALAALLGAVRERFADRAFDLLVYSGRAWGALDRDPVVRPALELCDAVVAGPFVARRAGAYRLRGSGNQRVVPLTALGAARYGGPDPVDPDPPGLQLSATGDRLYVVGIPRPGDMDGLADRLAAAGIDCGGLTWRS